jgi:holo-[acyl-carrier protein] synthase
MTLRVGVDLVRVSRIEESLARFGDRFLRRVFTPGEIEYAQAAPAQTAERLAARFAAKEAAIKALDLAERGVGWTQIEVARAPTGATALILRGAAADAAAGTRLAVSMSHEGDFATAVVVADAAINEATARDLTPRAPRTTT